MEKTIIERRTRENITCESCDGYRTEKEDNLRKQGYLTCDTRKTLTHRLEARECEYYSPRGRRK